MREGVKSTSDMVRIRKVLILRGTCAKKLKKIQSTYGERHQ